MSFKIITIKSTSIMFAKCMRSQESKSMQEVLKEIGYIKRINSKL